MEPHNPPGAPQTSTTKTSTHVRTIVVAAILLILTGIVLWMLGVGSYLFQRVEYAAKVATFSGRSELLKQTVIVPTLDSPCPPNKNVIWCSSFQLAWNEVRDKVIGAPLQVVGAEEVAGRLNQAQESTRDLESNSFYAAGGRIREGIIPKIKKDMAARFPRHPLPDLDQYGGEPGDPGILAYSYLRASVPFTYPFREVEDRFTFTDSAGVRTPVAAFGVWEGYRRPYRKMREQVEILFYRESDARNRPGEWSEYALDLCRHSRPYQVVIAMVEPKGSLAQTLEHVRLQTNEFKSMRNYDAAKSLVGGAVLEVPEMFWKIDHRFLELLGHVVANANPAMPFVEALQTTEFRLDRSGANLESEALIVLKAEPLMFRFDRPFLICVQKRGAEHPFFVMWVDNAELLTRK